MKRAIFLLILFFAPAILSAEKSVMLAILARNKAHVLPRYLRCIENQNYPKHLISIYIKTDNNADTTQELLKDWVEKNRELYKKIELDVEPTKLPVSDTSPHDWNARRFQTLALIRNKSLRKAVEFDCDYYFVVDCDNFIAPTTLSDLVAKDKPIIAPLLRSIPEPDDLYANFFYSCSKTGYYKHHENYFPILKRMMTGTFKVDLVHCTYLINSKYLDKLNYIDGTDDYEFIILARTARNNGIDQYITNEKEYGVQLHFKDNLTLEEEKSRIEAILTLP